MARKEKRTSQQPNILVSPRPGFIDTPFLDTFKEFPPRQKAAQKSA